MAKDCSNCIYKDREWGDNHCRTCDEECDNWVGVDEDIDYDGSNNYKHSTNQEKTR